LGEKVYIPWLNAFSRPTGDAGTFMGKPYKGEDVRPDYLSGQHENIREFIRKSEEDCDIDFADEFASIRLLRF
jgi:hypothetical protein